MSGPTTARLPASVRAAWPRLVEACRSERRMLARPSTADVMVWLVERSGDRSRILRWLDAAAGQASGSRRDVLLEVRDGVAARCDLD